MIKRLINFTILAAGTILVTLPLLTKNHIYDTIVASTDIKSHAAIISVIRTGETATFFLYPAQAIVGIPLGIVGKLTTISSNNLFLWFSFISLILVAVVLHFVITKTVNKQAGWLVPPIALLCTQSILALFSYGVIYSIINMYIILPLAIYLALKWLSKSKYVYLISSLMLFALFSTFHPTSLYLPYATSLIILAIIAVKIVDYAKKKHTTVMIKKPLLLSAGILALSLIIAKVTFSSITTPKLGSAPDAINHSTNLPTAVMLPYVPLTIENFALNFLSIATLILIFLAITGLIIYKKELPMSITAKRLIIVLVGLAGAAGVGTFTNLSPDPVRAALDFSSILAIMTAIILGILFQVKRAKWIVVVSVTAIAMGTVPTLASWIY